MEKTELDIIIIPENCGKKKVYSIYSIQVPNVVTQGKTIEEAKQMLREALGLYFNDMPEEKEKLICAEKQVAPLISRLFL